MPLKKLEIFEAGVEAGEYFTPPSILLRMRD